MKILVPALKIRTSRSEGEIIKTLFRHRVFESEVTRIEKDGRLFFIVKENGNEILISLDRVPETFKGSYRYILKKATVSQTESQDLFDVSKFIWIKHPLLNDSFKQKFSKTYVHESWKGALKIKSDIEHGVGLRLPQVGALYAIQAHWTISDEAGIVVLPTGTGKTDTMISALVSCRINTLLIVVPTDALRDQIAHKFMSLGILPLNELINDECESPVVGIIRHKFRSEQGVDSFFSECNVAVATMSVLAHCDSAIQTKIADCTSHLFIDEAHHTPADSWRLFKVKFTSNKILLFTATPFRNDGKRLDGKIIFNFPLRKAQELDYFRPIVFKPVNEYEYKTADRLIAETAVQQLREDLINGFDHIVMVRVNLIERANEILPLYAKYDEFRPIIVHSNIKPKRLLKSILKDIVEKKHRIIICVDMLGEGFDLPELKIAAFHDTKKSLTITLQLAGRFTRVQSNLGPATFIANIADPDVNEDLEDLYYRDSDWNILLPDMAYKMSLEQENFRSFLEGFKGFPEKFPIQSIKHPLSTIIFQTATTSWKPLEYKSGIKGVDSFQYRYSDYNKEQEILIVILGKRSVVKWARVQNFESVDWDLIVCYFDKAEKLLYLHASNTNSYYTSFVEAICAGANLVKGQMVFRCFSGINRIRLHNVGVREVMGRAINYIMRVGSDIKTALRDTEIKKAIKSNIFGVGFEHGSRVSIGCSHNGRIWSMRTNNILTWMNWCQTIGAKVTNPAIDTDLVLKGTLLPYDISSVPDELAFEIEWPDFIFRQSIGNFSVALGNEEYAIWDCDLSLKQQTKSIIYFDISLPSGDHRFELHIFKEGHANLFKFSSASPIFLVEGMQRMELNQFFLEYPPLIYFVDGSFLEGNLYTKIYHVIPEFSVDNFELHDWSKTNIKKESQTHNKFHDSIQYSIIQKLIQQNKYSIIIDDDDKEEIGDILTFRVFEDVKLLSIEIYHCKYSSEDFAGARVKDFYEVCGQAQRSIKWMENIEEIFKHLSRRSSDRFKRHGVDRFEIGDQNFLDILKRRSRKDLKVIINIFIVQPGLSFGDYEEASEISRLLAVVQTYLKETWNSNLKVIASE